MSCPCGYAVSAHMARHKRSCQVYQWNTKVTTLTARLKDAESKLKCKDKELCEKDKAIASLTEQLANERDKPRVINNITNNGDTNITNINLFVYGQEPSLAVGDVHRMIDSCILPIETVPRYIQMKHFSRPETHNIRLPNKRGRTIQVVEFDSKRRKRWVDKDRRQMLEKITEEGVNDLVDHYDAERSKRWNAWYESSGLKEENFEKTEVFREMTKKVEDVMTSNRAQNIIA